MSLIISFTVDTRDDYDTALQYALADTKAAVREHYGLQEECGEHGSNEPTCDICDRGQCFTEDMEWNGETGNHTECEARQRPDEFSNQFAPEPHVLKNVYDGATVEVTGTIDEEGNFVTSAGGYQVIDLDGDNYIYCETCDKRVYTNDEHGLSEEWQVL